MPRDTVHVVFRYDDCSASSSLALEQQMVDAFAECSAQITLGVIPQICEQAVDGPAIQRLTRITGPKATWLQRVAAAGSAEIGLHGYSHQSISTRQRSEFGGVDIGEQRRRIAAGKQELEQLTSARIKTFIPPWNAYDANTVAILEEHQFTCLSASVRGPFDMPTGIGFLPFTCRFDTVERAVAAVRPMRHASPVLDVVLHDFDFVESGHRDSWISARDFARRLRRLAGQSDVRLHSLGQAGSAGLAAVPEHLHWHRRWWRGAQNLPWRYRRVLEDQALWPALSNH